MTSQFPPVLRPLSLTVIKGGKADDKRHTLWFCYQGRFRKQIFVKPYVRSRYQELCANEYYKVRGPYLATDSVNAQWIANRKFNTSVPREAYTPDPQDAA
jgi:hypothetical protein